MILCWPNYVRKPRSRSQGRSLSSSACQGDKLDIFEKDGSICIMPVVVYPKHYLNELKEEISDVKAKLASGEQPVFDSVDALFDKLEAE